MNNKLINKLINEVKKENWDKSREAEKSKIRAMLMLIEAKKRLIEMYQEELKDLEDRLSRGDYSPLLPGDSIAIDQNSTTRTDATYGPEVAVTWTWPEVTINGTTWGSKRADETITLA